MINIRTCSDSGNAFIELLKYMATNGDVQQQTIEVNRTSPSMKKKSIEPPLRINNEHTSSDDVNAQISIADYFRLLFCLL